MKQNSMKKIHLLLHVQTNKTQSFLLTSMQSSEVRFPQGFTRISTRGDFSVGGGGG